MNKPNKGGQEPPPKLEKKAKGRKRGSMTDVEEGTGGERKVGKVKERLVVSSGKCPKRRAVWVMWEKGDSIGDQRHGRRV